LNLQFNFAPPLGAPRWGEYRPPPPTFISVYALGIKKHLQQLEVFQNLVYNKNMDFSMILILQMFNDFLDFRPHLFRFKGSSGPIAASRDGQ